MYLEFVDMCPKLELLPFGIAEMFAQVSNSGRITLADRYGLLAALLDENLSSEDQRSIDRLIRAIYRRRVRIVDDLSNVQNV